MGPTKKDERGNEKKPKAFPRKMGLIGTHITPPKALNLPFMLTFGTIQLSSILIKLYFAQSPTLLHFNSIVKFSTKYSYILVLLIWDLNL